jgi:hypothetical protein
MGHAAVDDFNTGENDGAGLFQVTQFHDEAKNGERCSAALGYLYPALSRPNLTVITKARATKILFEGQRAVGVNYRLGGKISLFTPRKKLFCVVVPFNLLSSCSSLALGGPLTLPGLALRWCTSYRVSVRTCKTT